ncbi:hypothetical protein BDR04DRAFT_1089714 [Suillus decipiens]|nr:hypothetical protein BDR04DRAFT_1089714 [Suillus decipiens]
MLNQLVPVNHEVLDDDFCGTSASPSSSLPSTNGMNLAICPNLGFVVTPSTVISSLNPTSSSVHH